MVSWRFSCAFCAFLWPFLFACLYILFGLPVTATARPQASWSFAGPVAATGRILALATDPRDGAVVHAGAAGGGVWKTQDGGASWAPLMDSGPSHQTCSLAVDPRTPDILYAGTGDDQSPRPLQGVARSVNGGKTWTLHSRFTNQPVCALAIDPSNSDRILAGSAEGLFLSSDSGSSWKKILDSSVTSIVFDQTAGVYAGTFGKDNPGSREQILARSTDGGLTWTNISLPSNPNATGAQTNWVTVAVEADVLSLVVSYQTTAIPPGTASSAQAPVSQLDSYRSTDRGITWSTAFAIGRGRPPFRLLAEPGTRYLYLGAATLLAYRGAEWSTVATTGTDFHTAAWTNGALILGGEKGIEAVSVAQGIPAPAITPLRVGQFLSAQFDSTTGIWAAGLPGLYHVFPFTGSPEVRASSVAAAGNVAIADNGTDLFVTNNTLVYRSTDSGANFTSRTVIASGEPRAPSPPLALDPMMPGTAYVAGQRVYRTTDNGGTWTSLAVDPDPTRVVIALAVAPASRTTLIAATACLSEVALVSCPVSSSIWRSTNAGTSWVQTSSVPGLVSRLAIDPRITNTVYAAIGAFPGGASVSAGTAPGGLLRSTDGGNTWSALRNLPQAPVNTILIDPASLPPQTNQPAQKLYAGTDAGVFLSFNAGANWTDISGTTLGRLPASPVTDLALRSDGMLLAATFGRGIYYLPAASLTPVVVANPISVNVTVTEGATASTALALTNLSNSTTLAWELIPLDAWISVPTGSGSLRPLASLEAPVRISAGSLKAGDYRGRLQLVSSSFAQHIFLEVRVTAAPAELRIISANNVIGPPGAALPPLRISVLDARQVPVAGVAVSFGITSGGGFLSATTVVTNSAGVASVILTLPPVPGTVRVAASHRDLSIIWTVTAMPAPMLLSDRVVDGVTFNTYTPLGPGGIVSMSGSNLARATVIAPASSLPLSLQETQARLISAGAEVSLPLLSVSPVQVRSMLPFDLAPGTYRIRVDVGVGRSNEVEIYVASFAPGIFTRSGTGQGLGVFTKPDGSVVTAANPADRGATVTFFAAGLGAVTPAITAGQSGAIQEPLNRTASAPKVFFDSYPAEVLYSGLVPGSPGRYQVTVRVPSLVAPATNISLSLTIGGFASNRVTIPVR